jgi:hypothetical protein
MVAVVDDLKKAEEALVAGAANVANAGVGVAGDVAGVVVDVASNALHEALDLVKSVLKTVTGE